MKTAILLLTLFLTFPISIFSQIKEDQYFVKFISEIDSSEMKYIGISELVDDTMTAGWITGMDGVIEIPFSQVSSHAIFRSTATGYETFYFLPNRLLLNDTVQFTLISKPIRLNEMIISSYRKPMIENDQLKRKKKKKIDPISKEYTPSEYTFMDSLGSGEWFNKQPKGIPILFNEFANYLQGKIQYPIRDWENNVEETIYFGFRCDENGSMIKVHLLKADSPLFAMEAAKALVQISRILPNELGILLKPVEYILPIRFELK